MMENFSLGIVFIMAAIVIWMILGFVQKKKLNTKETVAVIIVELK